MTLETTLLFIVLILLALVLGLIAFLFVKMSHLGKDGSDNSKLERLQIESAASLKAEIANIERSILSSVDAKIETRGKDEQLALSSALQESAEKENARFQLLQANLGNTLLQQSKATNELLNARLEQTRRSSEETIANMTKQMAAMAEADNKRLSDFQTNMNAALNIQIKTMNERMDASIKAINEKVDSSLSEGFKSTSESMANLQKQLGIVEQAQKNLGTLENEISSLNGILSNNQERGKYGEWQLELLLSAMFDGGKGTLYETQYSIDEGLRADAVIFLDGSAHHQMVAIDSKFSLTGYEDLFDSSKSLTEIEKSQAQTSFRNAIKARIDETSKYVIPGKTLGNALMFVPNDGVFAYIHNEFGNLIEYARSKHVVLVSPTILQPLLGSFRVVQIDAAKSKNIAAINAALSELAKEFQRFTPRWAALNKNIQQLTSKSAEFETTVNKIGTKFTRIQSLDLSSKEDGKEELEGSEPEDDAIDLLS